jgi:hypothetical protein
LLAVCLWIPPVNFGMPEPIFTKLGMHVMATESVSTAFFINPSHQTVCLYVYPSYRCKTTVRLSGFLHSLLGNGPINTFLQKRIQATVKELLDPSFSIRSVSYRRRVVGFVHPPVVARYQLGKDVSGATKNCWRRRFICVPCRMKGK